MRIISGKYKGKQLQASKDQSIRPTTNKIKEYIFDLINDYLEEAVVLDLFCGSGNLGLEAMSRGAQSVTFVDNNQGSLRVLRRNLSVVKVEEPFKIVRKDAVLFLKKNRQPFDLIFVDPPFKWKEFDKMMPLLFDENNLTEFGLVVMESEVSHEVVWESDSYELLRQKKFDRSVISFLTRKGIV